MGLLINGIWRDQWYETDQSGGAFVRGQSSFRNWITADGRPGPDGQPGLPAAIGRYHLYVSLACPWAHRTLIYRQIKGLEDMISISVVHWLMGEQGWMFKVEQGATEDALFGAQFLHEIYTQADARYSGRVTVPVLWDKKTAKIVNNESSDIIRMLNSSFDGIGALFGDYYPVSHQNEINLLNARIYETLNNGVYRAGFATTQAAYEAAIGPLFETLDWLEVLLGKQKFLCGDAPLEADWRLITTLLRFDPVYYGHFKCNLKQLREYTNLWRYTRTLYQWKNIRETVNFSHIKRHYYMSHPTINPTRIVPLGPEIDFSQAVAR